jgi:mycothiol S-conjugate amidase
VLPRARTGTYRRADYFPVRLRALLAHDTQIDPDGPAMSGPLRVEQTTWPTEDHHLARSGVDTALPEDDLFAGIVPGSPAAEDLFSPVRSVTGETAPRAS